MANALTYLPELDDSELVYVNSLFANMTNDQAQQFAMVYRARRKDPQMILILTLIGFFGVAGINRIMLNQVGMGILYFLTAGLCFIGVIIDLVNYRKMTAEYNQNQAYLVAQLIQTNSTGSMSAQ
ncbi:MAG: TM2 domain-containing protein [Chlorobi bacterium]|nr:MAG: TM2 domain-containing protein [Bacteroidota bacterium]KXK34686.1 MAG: TM2 domain-containing protein [Chlorobi bacterium OLB6]MBE2264975.1 TM2 domain-containing protein [Flavobacteriales bacterium]MBL1160988.1 TM2 domain-containing protein [Chlorobiota bacterium]MBW7852946.1 TM2 domain-containing protein [Candidatus Kapabacteria bacterium]MCC6330802.1 TM2 domain-containing protein [Ignavibacteria bacterium]